MDFLLVFQVAVAFRGHCSVRLPAFFLPLVWPRWSPTSTWLLDPENKRDAKVSHFIGFTLEPPGGSGCRQVVHVPLWARRGPLGRLWACRRPWAGGPCRDGVPVWRRSRQRGCGQVRTPSPGFWNGSAARRRPLGLRGGLRWLPPAGGERQQGNFKCKSRSNGFKVFNFLPGVDRKTQRRQVTFYSNLRSEQIHSERIQDVSDVAGHRCEHCGAPSCSVDLIEDKQTRKDKQQKEVLNLKESQICNFKTVRRSGDKPIITWHTCAKR